MELIVISLYAKWSPLLREIILWSKPIGNIPSAKLFLFWDYAHVIFCISNWGCENVHKSIVTEKNVFGFFKRHLEKLLPLKSLFLSFLHSWKLDWKSLEFNHTFQYFHIGVRNVKRRLICKTFSEKTTIILSFWQIVKGNIAAFLIRWCLPLIYQHRNKITIRLVCCNCGLSRLQPFHVCKLL